jgi:hypothetical protein
MRPTTRLLPLLLTAACASSFAQQRPRLEPLPDVPPPPGMAVDAPGDTPISITPGQNDQVEETLIDGKRTIKVTQPGGRVYYLQEQEPGEPAVNDGLSPRVRAPRWVIKEF